MSEETEILVDELLAAGADESPLYCEVCRELVWHPESDLDFEEAVADHLEECGEDAFAL